MRRRLNLPHRLHKRILHRNSNITPTVPLTQPSQPLIIPGPQLTRRAPHGQLKHLHSRRQIRQTYVYSALESSPNGRVELPGDVCGAEDEHAPAILADAVHLHEHLCFYAARGFGFAFAAGAAQGVDLVDEDDGGFVFAGHVEELLD